MGRLYMGVSPNRIRILTVGISMVPVTTFSTITSVFAIVTRVHVALGVCGHPEGI